MARARANYLSHGFATYESVSNEMPRDGLLAGHLALSILA